MVMQETEVKSVTVVSSNARIVMQRDELVKVVKLVASARNPKSTLPYLAWMKIERTKDGKVRFTCTNLERTFSLVRNAVEPLGALESFFVDAKAFSTVLTAMRGEWIILTPGKNNLNIQDEISSVNLKTEIYEKDFPGTIPFRTNCEPIEISRLVESAERLAFAASVDDARPVLKGVFIDGNNFMATDGFRIAVLTAHENSQKETFILPARRISEVKRLLHSPKNYLVKWTNEFVAFDDDGSAVMFQMIDGRFPDCRAILPKQSVLEVTVDRRQMLQAITLADTFSKKFGNHVCRFEVSLGTLAITSECEEYGKTKASLFADVKTLDDGILKKNVAEEPFMIAFNAGYILEFLRRIWSEKVIMRFTTNNAPGLFLPGDKSDGLKYVCMPIHIG